jgi:hypothetical protein
MAGFLVFAYYRAALFGTAATMVSFTFGQVTRIMYLFV